MRFAEERVAVERELEVDDPEGRDAVDRLGAREELAEARGLELLRDGEAEDRRVEGPVEVRGVLAADLER